MVVMGYRQHCRCFENFVACAAGAAKKQEKLRHGRGPPSATTHPIGTRD